jgi:hypothetical protein
VEGATRAGWKLGLWGVGRRGALAGVEGGHTYEHTQGAWLALSACLSSLGWHDLSAAIVSNPVMFSS